MNAKFHTEHVKFVVSVERYDTEGTIAKDTHVLTYQINSYPDDSIESIDRKVMFKTNELASVLAAKVRKMYHAGLPEEFNS